MKKLFLLVAIIATTVFSNSFGQVDSVYVVNLKNGAKAPKYRQTKVLLQPVTLEANIAIPRDTIMPQITLPPAQVYLMNENNNSTSWMVPITLVAIIGLVILGLFFYNREGNPHGIRDYLDTQLVDSIGNNGGTYDHKVRTRRGIEKIRLTMLAPSAATTALRSGRQSA